MKKSVLESILSIIRLAIQELHDIVDAGNEISIQVA